MTFAFGSTGNTGDAHADRRRAHPWQAFGASCAFACSPWPATCSRSSIADLVAPEAPDFLESRSSTPPARHLWPASMKAADMNHPDPSDDPTDGVEAIINASDFQDDGHALLFIPPTGSIVGPVCRRALPGRDAPPAPACWERGVRSFAAVSRPRGYLRGPPAEQVGVESLPTSGDLPV